MKRFHVLETVLVFVQCKPHSTDAWDFSGEYHEIVVFQTVNYDEAIKYLVAHSQEFLFLRDNAYPGFRWTGHVA